MVSSRTVLTSTAAVMALGAAAFGGRPVAASVHSPESHAVVHSPLLKPVRLDKSSAQLKLVQVVFRWGGCLDGSSGALSGEADVMPAPQQTASAQMQASQRKGAHKGEDSGAMVH